MTKSALSMLSVVPSGKDDREDLRAGFRGAGGCVVVDGGFGVAGRGGSPPSVL